MSDQVLYTAHGRVLYIPVSVELAAKLGEDWSEPVQIRIDGDVMAVRSLAPCEDVRCPCEAGGPCAFRESDDFVDGGSL